jgi:hypothetical protein
LDRNQKRQDDIEGEERKRNRKEVEKREQRKRKESFVSSLQAGYLVSRSLLEQGRQGSTFATGNSAKYTERR